MCEHRILEEVDSELVNYSVDWCLVNNCSLRWALRWQHVEEDLEIAIKAKEKALDDIKNAPTKCALKRAKLERSAASVAIHRAMDSRISLMLSQRIATAKWLERIKNKKTADEEKIRRQKQKCFEEMVEEKRCAAIINRIREWDALAAKRGKGWKPEAKSPEKKPSDTKTQHDEPPDDKQPPGSGQKPAESGQKPAEPGQKPAESGQKPAEPGQKPAESGQKPAESGNKPTEAGAKPPDKPKPPEAKTSPPATPKPPDVSKVASVSPGGRKL